MTIEAFEQTLWSDLSNEQSIRRAIARAHDVTARVWGDPRQVLQAAAARGLIATVTRGDSADDRATTIEICGPLALLHQTAVYGRALAGVVPYIVACDRFELAMRCDFGHGETTIRLAPPALLPVAKTRVLWKLVDRLARELAERGLAVDRDPPLLAAGPHFAVPDLAFERTGGRVHVEVVGFWTEPYLAAKLARYRAANATVVLCLDAARMHADDTPPPGAFVVTFTGRISVDDVLKAVA